MEALDLLNELVKLAIAEHSYCKDSWYSCPLAEEGCSNPKFAEDECTCGVEVNNEKILAIADKLYKKIKELE